MYKLYKTSDKRIIAYKYHKSKKKTKIAVVFLHGLMSNSESSKATSLYNYCVAKDIDFVVFDNFGHGKSSGNFEDQTISTWLEGLMLVLSEIVDQDVLLIGSSAGAWIAMLGAISCKKVRGLITIAGAPDFTEMIWDALQSSEQERMRSEGVVDVGAYPISYNLIKDGHSHLLLGREDIAIHCPIHLIHGVQDKDVHYEVSSKVFEKVVSKDVVLKLIKDGGHSLSEPPSMKVITNSLDEMLELLAVICRCDKA